MRRAKQERGLAARIAGSDGYERMAAYAAGKKLPWTVGVGLDVDESLPLTWLQLKQHLYCLLAALLVGLAVAYRLAGAVARPVNYLTHAAERLAGGDNFARAMVAGHREVLQLDRAFNNMAAAVQS